MIDARPVVGLAATPKSSYKSRFPVQVAPDSQTPPLWITGVAACWENKLPTVVAWRVCAETTYPAAADGEVLTVFHSEQEEVPYQTTATLSLLRLRFR